MHGYRFILFCAFAITACAGPSASAIDALSVMSFNVWGAEGSESGRAGIIAAIEAGGADIVGFQEMGGGQGPVVAGALGMQYDGGSMIASAYPIVDTSFNNGVRVELEPGQDAYVFNVHLVHAPYGPYQLAGIPYFGGALYDPNDPADIAAVVQDQVDARGGAVASLISEMSSVLNSGLPVFLTGDFNEAPHLDWIAEAVAAGVHSAVVPWPTSTELQNAGLVDSYREVHPDVVARPGNTWSPVFGPDYINAGVNETQDRIDLVYYAGLGVEAIRSNTVGPDDGISDISADGFPSDHRAIVTEFSLPDCIIAGDLNLDCFVDAADWKILRANQHTDMTGLTLAEARVLGDMNGDLANNHVDFVLFKTAFESLNGAGSFAAMASVVPEPGSVWLLALCMGLIGRRWRMAS